MYPNQRHQDSFVKAGLEYSIPDPGMAFEFEIGPPYGTDLIQAVATSRPTPALYGFRSDRDSGLRSVDDGVRGIVVKQKDALAALPGDQKAEAVITFTTVP